MPPMLGRRRSAGCSVTAAGGLVIGGMGSTATRDFARLSITALCSTVRDGPCGLVMGAEPGLLDDALPHYPALLSVSFGTTCPGSRGLGRRNRNTVTQCYDKPRARRAFDFASTSCCAGVEGGRHGEVRLSSPRASLLDSIFDRCRWPLLACEAIASARSLAGPCSPRVRARLGGHSAGGVPGGPRAMQSRPCADRGQRNRYRLSPGFFDDRRRPCRFRRASRRAYFSTTRFARWTFNEDPLAEDGPPARTGRVGGGRLPRRAPVAPPSDAGPGLSDIRDYTSSGGASHRGDVFRGRRGACRLGAISLRALR